MACMKLIKREKYIERLANLRGTPDIKIITGVRRAGKSKLLEAFRDQLSSEDGVNIVFIDLSCLENEKLLEYHALNEYVLAKTRDGVENVLMIDEVQECEGFERVINSLHNAGKYDIYLTGSNAFLLSSDLATLFTGRQIEVPVYPFSFSEFLAQQSFRVHWKSSSFLTDPTREYAIKEKKAMTINSRMPITDAIS